MATGIKDQAMSSLGSLIKLLPTGTVFLFQFLSPVLTHNGKCKTVNKYLSGTLVIVCGLSCFFSTFTDSYKDLNGNTRYGIVTRKGLWPNSETSEDLSKKKFRIRDLVHAYLALLVFAVVALLDKNTRDCFYPSFHSEDVLQALPPVIGFISGTVFALSPNTRHGIGLIGRQLAEMRTNERITSQPWLTFLFHFLNRNSGGHTIDLPPLIPLKFQAIRRCGRNQRREVNCMASTIPVQEMKEEKVNHG